ncbi:MAG: ribosome maturation factor RimM [Actinomycetaceae bacterium]|nr:ribosome maturation factor RimM [Actinomycetaceae bacterium]MDY6082970.1 ribosome maturation factor RimM [Actinomycetaceae bacterium]
MQLVVAVIGSAHGLKGEVKLDVRTDDPDQRLTVGATFETDPADFGPLTLENVREAKGSVFARFDDVTNRSAAEELRGVALTIETDEEDNREPDSWYLHELKGLQARDPSGSVLGSVIGFEPMPAQDLLQVRLADSSTVLVPFVRQIVPDVNVDAGYLVIDAPPGLLSDEGLDMVPRDDAPVVRDAEDNDQ